MKATLRLSITLSLVLWVISLKAQQNNVWYFGYFAGLDFNSGSPVVLTNSAMFAPEGCAAISDSLGKLLFYTEGTGIFNRFHKIMDNGSGLAGGSSATQAAAVIPWPGISNFYYLVTADEQ